MILTTFQLSSANAFNLDQSKILSFGKGLRKNLLHKPYIDRSFKMDDTLTNTLLYVDFKMMMTFLDLMTPCHQKTLIQKWKTMEWTGSKWQPVDPQKQCRSRKRKKLKQRPQILKLRKQNHPLLLHLKSGHPELIGWGWKVMMMMMILIISRAHLFLHQHDKHSFR